MDIARETALKVLYDINEKGAYSNIALNKYLGEYALKDVDRALATDLVYGTVKWKLALDRVIEQFSSVRLKKISPWIINILRLGVYQLLFTSRIPESAACNECVKLSKKYGHAASSGFVNAVLRNIARNRDIIRYPDRDKEYEEYLSVKYSHPQWIVRHWLSRFGGEFTESLLDSNNEIPEFTVRTNTLKLYRDQLIEEFRKEGIEAVAGRYHEEAVILKNPSSIARLDSYRQGLFQVQDESSMLVGSVLDPWEGELVIDVCSAPGGKATHIAGLMKGHGTVIARDIHQHKISIINDAAKRLGTTNIKTEIFDATHVDERYIGKADRVLVDAPCTGLGIIRRKPDIKWARTESDIKEITALQESILEASSKYVKQGGFLVYSTCTIEPEENEEMVKKFIKSNPEFNFVDISDILPVELTSETTRNGYIQIFPNIHKIDGFFIAKLKRGDC